MSDILRTRAIVLRRTNYGESDRILKLLTTDGEKSVIAKGARKEKSKLAGGIELFGVSDVTIRYGRGDLGLLTSVSLEKFFSHILDDYDRLQFAYEVTNIVSKVIDQVDEPHWFDVLLEIYKGLDDKNMDLQLVQTWFYLHYSSLTGYELSLERDVTDQKLSADKSYMYDVTEKGLRPSEQGDIRADHIKFLRLVASKSLTVVASVGGVKEILPTCWLLARTHAAF